MSVATALVMLAALLWRQAAAVDTKSVLVRKVIDGDTIELASGQRVRYIGIDTPETRRKTDAGWQEVDEPFAAESRAFNEKYVQGKKVRLEFDAQRQDKYQRLLAYCFVEGDGREVFVAEELLREGLAYLYTIPPNVKYVDRLLAALEEAKRNRAGLWSLDLETDSKEARRFVGERRLVSGRVQRARQTPKVTTLELPGMNVVIFARDLEFFKKEGIDPKASYQDKIVRVFGLIKEYRGKAEVIVSHPGEIEINEGTT